MKQCLISLFLLICRPILNVHYFANKKYTLVFTILWSQGMYWNSEPSTVCKNGISHRSRFRKCSFSCLDKPHGCLTENNRVTWLQNWQNQLWNCAKTDELCCICTDSSRAEFPHQKTALHMFRACTSHYSKQENI